MQVCEREDNYAGVDFIQIMFGNGPFVLDIGLITVM